MKKKYILGSSLEKDVARMSLILDCKETEVLRRAIQLMKLGVESKKILITLNDGTIIEPKIK